MKHLEFLKEIKIKNKNKTLKVGTDCSGIEAPIMALKLMNIPFEHIFSCENDPHVIKSIYANYSPQILYNDIFTRDHNELPYVDLYVSGFPCQSFSKLGKMKGMEDVRGTIFFHCYKTIEVIRPKCFILENVKTLVSHNKGATFSIILQKLDDLKDYNIYWKIYNTMDYGIPQKRERVYIIGIKKSEEKNKFEHQPPIPLKINVKDILVEGSEIGGKYDYLTDHKKEMLGNLVQKGKIVNLQENWSVNLNVSADKLCYPKKDICPCLLAGNGGDCIFYLTSIARRYTPREYLNLQGFGEFKQDVSNSKLYKQVGNAMSVNILCFIIKSVYECIK